MVTGKYGAFAGECKAEMIWGMTRRVDHIERPALALNHITVP
jgi:hypothetical protein